ncbi:AMP-binding protein [Erwinia sp. JUb26]|uniref:AMP-binding protein n=1 Tax=Erwinia sp. JUb26 TaxID=2485126 RepID=UPI000FB6B680|nr:AMP-binding protein [Erwinia sp. JUb26]ROR09902.1 propionyl-CoA synthetase [Erwinia sp. JUb26]
MTMLTMNDNQDGFSRTFWQQEARRIHWQRAFRQVVAVTERGPRCRWFPDGTTNLCFNALDRHLDRRGDRCAIIHRDYQGRTHRLTYRQLWQQVNALSSLMIQWGIKPGDRVTIAQPMTPQAAVAMLACARIGAVHVVVYSAMTSDALAQRIAACQPVLLLHHGDPRGRGILPHIPPSSATMRVVDTASAEFAQHLALHQGQITPCVWLDSDQPSHILFTSGTTGTPKGIVRDTGGYAVALLASLHHLFKLGEDEICFTSADVGWVTGHSYGVYAPLLAGLTTVMCEASPVNSPGQSWWQMIDELGITRVLTIAGAIRLARQQGAPRASLGSLRTLYLAGEPLDDATERWVKTHLAVKCENHYWQTESGWPLLAGEGSALNAVFTRGVDIVHPGTYQPCADGVAGLLLVKDTLGPGAMLTLWDGDEAHDRQYWVKISGRWHYLTHDCAVRQDGRIAVRGRMDEVINVGGKRVATAEIENALTDLEGIVEVVATRMPHHLLGEMVALYVVTEDLDACQLAMLKHHIRETLTARCGRHVLPRRIHFRHSLPKTFSGKIVRRRLSV